MPSIYERYWHERSGRKMDLLLVWLAGGLHLSSIMHHFTCILMNGKPHHAQKQIRKQYCPGACFLFCKIRFTSQKEDRSTVFWIMILVKTRNDGNQLFFRVGFFLWQFFLVRVQWQKEGASEALGVFLSGSFVTTLHLCAALDWPNPLPVRLITPPR